MISLENRHTRRQLRRAVLGVLPAACLVMTILKRNLSELQTVIPA